MLTLTALFISAFLFGGMLLYSFGFAAFLFSHLPPEDAGSILRKAFPVFYLWCIGVSSLAAAIFLYVDTRSALLMAIVAVTTIPVRQRLMPSIDAATDSRNKRRFNQLHGFSVLIGIGQIALVGYALSRLIT